MNDGPKLFSAAVTIVMLALLSTMSPALGALAANLIRPAIGMAAKRSKDFCRILERARCSIFRPGKVK